VTRVSDDAALERLRAAVPANVREVCEALARAGHEAVVVGGCVRDVLIGRTPGDWDVATSARPEQVIATFKRTVPTGLQHGTVTVVTGRGPSPLGGEEQDKKESAKRSHVEVTTFRGEGAYTDARRPDHVVFGVPLHEDLARRDLRVNAMAYDPAKDVLIDPFDGRRDLADRTLRAVGPTGNVFEDAVGRFTEDGLRVMRAVRFAAQLELALDPETERGIRPALPSLAKVSRARVSDELRKMLRTRQPSRALAIAERTGIIALILPELVEGWATWDSVRGGRPQLIERWLARVDAVGEPARLAALVLELAPYHDQLYRLDRRAVKGAGDVLRRLKFSNDELAAAATVVGTASATVNLEPEHTAADVRRLLADVTRTHAAHAVEVWRASGATRVAAEAAARLAANDPLAASELAVTGNDLIHALAMQPGPLIGRLLTALLDRVHDDPALNTREQLLDLARGLELQLAR
jgi:tRNA nucleotidyltransferase (CCA-adding enzyme)